MPLKTVLKSVLIFVNGELFEVHQFKTKRESIGNFRLWKKHGKFSSETFEKIENATFQIL